MNLYELLKNREPIFTYNHKAKMYKLYQHVIVMTDMGWQWGKMPWKLSPYIQVRGVLCYKPISIIYRTSLLQNSLKVIIYQHALLTVCWVKANMHYKF